MPSPVNAVEKGGEEGREKRTYTGQKNKGLSVILSVKE